MSKVLKRPMFRIGGSANDGIMSMTQPRKNYDEGSDVMQQAEMNRKLFQQFVGPGRSERNRLMDLLLEGSLELGAGAGAGKKLPQALALSFKGPAQRFIKSGQDEENFQRQLGLSAVTSALKRRDEMELAKLKYGMEAGKDADLKIREIMSQYTINRPQATNFQNFLLSKNQIERITGLPVFTDPLTLAEKKNKDGQPILTVDKPKNMQEGIYFDPKNGKYIKIQGGVALIGNSIQELIQPKQGTIRVEQPYKERISEAFEKIREQKRMEKDQPGPIDTTFQ